MDYTFFTFKVLAANGTWRDYSDIVQVKGIGWKRQDRFAGSVEYTIDKHLHKVKMRNARVISFRLKAAPLERYAALDDDLSQPVVKVQYSDIHGVLTKDFICDSFSATVDVDINSFSQASGGSFTLEEV